jgi:hypothetical protein
MWSPSATRAWVAMTGAAIEQDRQAHPRRRRLLTYIVPQT